MSAPWDDLTLDAAGQWLSGGTPSKQSASLWEGTLPWVSPKDMKRARIADAIDHVANAAVGNGTQLAPVGSLLMVVRGMILAHTFPVAMTTAPVTFNQDIKALVPGDGWSSEFLLHWLQFKAPEVLRLVEVANHGTKRLPSERLFALPLPRPPAPEQKKIAAILSSVDEAMEATQAVIDQLQIVKKAMMAELLTRGLPGRHTRFKQTEIGEVPEDWDVVPVSVLGHVQLGKMRSPVHTKGRLRPYLRVANVLDGIIRATDVLEMLFEDSEWEKFRLRDGDILLNEGQSLELVGRSAIYKGVPSNCAFQKTLLRFRAGPTVSSEFMQAQFQMCLYSGRFAEHAVQTTSIAHLTGVRFCAMRMVRPALDEQRDIAEVVSALESRLDAENAAASALAAVKAALMSMLLTGEVRVKPDEDAA